METHDEHQYVKFPITEVETMTESIISHEEICEPNVLSDPLAESSADQANAISESQEPMTTLTDQSDEEDDKVYPIYVKEEEQHQYTSGDDESMAVEALRQLGGMYPCFENKKVTCANCASIFLQSELEKHQRSCATTKLSCTTCGERFERKQDLNNHMVCHQVDRPHACRTCGNLFRSKANLQAHMTQVHQSGKPHKCAICGADFQRPSSLSNHMKIHTYVAGRALMQSQNNETLKKWPDNISESIASASTVPVENYDVAQVQWSVPSYNFAETSIATLAGSQDKMDTLQEFTVMPNGEVTQFEYAQQNSIGQQYGLSMNSFENCEGTDKVEDLTFVGENRQRNYVEVEINDSGTKQHTCVHCGANFSRATALASHSKIHGTKGWTMPIECEYCDKQFQDGNHLATHQTTCAKKIMQDNVEQGVANNKWGKHACTECGKKFTTKQKMFRHQWIHRKKTHTCEICGSQFEKQNQLDEHRLSAHPGDSPFTCTECGKSFVSRQGLWEHGRTHAGSPAHFHCDTCSKTFSSRQGYLIHHRTHTGERPYGCKFCWKAFRDGGTLRKHERIHTGERPHVCPLCSRAFNQKVVLREHVRWVHAAGKNETEITGPPFPCPLCGALNQDRDELCAHIVKHSDQMIAEAKAKTNNNATKPKFTKKKSKTPGNSRKKNSNDNQASAEEQNEALLSIAEVVAAEVAEDSTKIDQDVNETLILIGPDKHMEIDDDLRVLADGKNCDASDDLIVATSDDNTIITKIRNSDILHLIQNSKRNDTLHLIASGKNNTLHLITKQNEALPVLALPNPQNHDNYSSQISSDITDGRRDDVGQIGNDGETNLIDEETNQVINVAHYLEDQRRESDDEDEEMVCGICGDDFDDKNVLMEHVKIHI